MKKKKESEKDKKKKKILIIIGAILLLIILFLIWWFNRKFDVVVKYNNGTDNTEVKIKYLKKLDPNLLVKNIKMDGYNFVGFYETYELTKDVKEGLIKNPELEKTVCKEKFKLNSDKNKCISETEFDFEGTKIKKATTIEALWSGINFVINPTSKNIKVEEKFKITATITGSKDKTVTFTSSNPAIAKVDNNGNVVGVKEGQTEIIAESNGIKRTCKVIVSSSTTTAKTTSTRTTTTVATTTAAPKDEGKISLRANDQCIVGNSDVVTITATVNNATDKTVKWTLPKCYTSEKVSDTVVKLNRTGRGTQCRDVEERTFTVTAKLNNGSSDSIKITYEPKLEVKVYDGSSLLGTINNGDNKSYIANNVNIKTNFSVSFSGNYISPKSGDSTKLDRNSQSVITIKSTCGQRATVDITPEIN